MPDVARAEQTGDGSDGELEPALEQHAHLLVGMRMLLDDGAGLEADNREHEVLAGRGEYLNTRKRSRASTRTRPKGNRHHQQAGPSRPGPCRRRSLKLSVSLCDPLARAVDEFFASAAIDLLEHVVELLAALQHAGDEGGKPLAHFGGHHGFDECE